MTREELRASWEIKREVLALTGAYIEGSKAYGQCLDDLTTVEQSEANTLLTLKEAAAYSGYAIDHLSRLIRQGRIRNAGRRGAPRIRLGDLPLRRQFARNANKAYSVETDARSLLSRRGDRHYDASNSKAK